jgi:hypothetical protein
VVFASIFLASLGLILSLVVLFAGVEDDHLGSSYRIGDDIAIGFGTLKVTSVDEIAGLSPEALSGQDHGIGGLVPEGSMEIQASVTLGNSTSAPVRYSSNAFRLAVAGTDEMLEPVGSTLGDGDLAAGSSVSGAIRFVVPASGVERVLLYRDRSRQETLAVSLGTVAAPERSNGHDESTPHP